MERKSRPYMATPLRSDNVEHPLTALEDVEFGTVKQMAIESHRRQESNFIEKLQRNGVAIYTGDPDRYMNAHLTDFVGTVSTDGVVFVELHRTQDLVERTLDNLPQFDNLPVIIARTSRRPFLSLGDKVCCLRLCFDEVQPRRILRPVAQAALWSIMATVTYIQGAHNRQLSMLVVGGCSAFQVFAFLAQNNVPVHQIITPD